MERADTAMNVSSQRFDKVTILMLAAPGTNVSAGNYGGSVTQFEGATQTHYTFR
jgi:hypothetical protein